MQASAAARPGRLLILRGILSTPFSIALFIASGIGYYLLIDYIILASSKGLALVTAPLYMIYIVAITSALLLTVSVYSIRLSLRYELQGISEGTASVLTTFIGSLISSCGCSAPILAVILYSIGVNAFGVSSALSFINSNQYLLLGIVSLVNLLLIYYSVGKVAEGCRIDKKGKIKVK